MGTKFIKKCSAISTEQISFSSCQTNYSISQEAVFSYEDLSELPETADLAESHMAFKRLYQDLNAIPENAEVQIGNYIFKTGLKHKRGLLRPEVSCIEYHIEELI